MAYKLLSDVVTVKLGGIDSKTGQKNPTSIEGFFLRVEKRPNSYNPEKPQNYWVFKTKEGGRGVYGSAGVDREMKKAKLGVMTLLIATGKLLPSKNGNPMKVFEVQQDDEQAIEIESVDTTSGYTSLQDFTSDFAEDNRELMEDLEEPALPPPTIVSRAPAPQIATRAPSAEQQARVKAMLASRTK